MIQYKYFIHTSNLKYQMNPCPNCKKSSTSHIGLICDHTICMQCAQKIKSIEGQSNIQNKYRLICPQCKKITVTYDIVNLIINNENSQNSILLFQNLESSQINQSSLAEDRGQLKKMDGFATTKQFSHRDLKEMSYSQRFNNLIAQRKQSKTPEIPFDRKQNRSKFSQDSGRANNNNSKTKVKQQQYTTKCHVHNEGLLFFCENQKKLLCIECMYKHTRQNKVHKVVSVKNSMEIINKENLLYKEETRSKLDEVDKCLKICETNKEMVKDAFQSHIQLVKQEFTNLYTILKHRQEHLKECLKLMYTQKQKQLTSHIANLSYIKNCLKQYHNFPIQGNNSEVYFFNAYTTMKIVIQKIDLSFKLFQKQSFILLQKGYSLDEFKTNVQKYLHFKKERKIDSRLSENPITLNNRGGLNDEIKNAKKKLQKLEKMQKQQKPQKPNHYLNNYIISLNKKQQNDSQKQTIRQRKCSGTDFQKKMNSKPITPTTRVSSKLKQNKK